MAEGLLKHAFDRVFADSKIEIAVKSCGITGLLESQAAEIATELVLERGSIFQDIVRNNSIGN